MLSVLIPTKNRSNFLRRLLLILLSNNSPVEKVLIGNDASTDDTEEVITSFKERHPNKIHNINNLNSIGAVATSSLLYQYVNTKYIMFMSDDDFFDPILINKLLNHIEKRNYVLGFGKYSISENSKLNFINHSGWVSRDLYQNDFLCLLANDHYMFFAATIFLKSSLPKYAHDNFFTPFDLSLNEFVNFDSLGEFRGLDWDLALSLSCQFPNRIFFLDEYVATFSITKNQLSSDDNYQFTGRAAFEMAILILKHLTNYQNRYLLSKNQLATKNILHLLLYKISLIKSHDNLYALNGYLPVINSSKVLLESLINTSN